VRLTTVSATRQIGVEVAPSTKLVVGFPQQSGFVGGVER
jgi:hypothetical protein